MSGTTGTDYHLVLLHKTNQIQGIFYFTTAYYCVTKTFVARIKFPHVKVARNIKKVGQACYKPRCDSFDVQLCRTTYENFVT